ncbi:MAG: D-alanyl-D-alanine carboxypeptidase family protein [Oscillospiraceae bacterium]|nr:D-alanyl-D-alanine carboxypeptidase family protein [Oscillospiraceae bacterium]
MSGKKKSIIAGIVAAALVLCGLLLSYFVFQVPLFDASGWVTEADGTVRYRNYFGRLTTGWVTVEGERYYFNEQAAMETGWVTTEEGTYFLAPDGVMQTGWLTQNEDRYYLQPDGAAYAGWLDAAEGTYYFGSDFKMHTGWLLFEENHYYLAADGIMQTGWLDLETGRYYLHPQGHRHTGWLDMDEGRYYLNADGIMQTGWLNAEDGIFFLAEDGKAHTGWLTIPQGRYYMQENGAAVTGFVTLEGTRRFFEEDGKYVPLVNPWNPITSDYQLQLVKVEGYQVDATCAEALQTMLSACRKAGNKVRINSAYRDEKKQQSIWEDYRKNYMAQGYSYAEAEKMTAGYVAVPGTSEHHLGVGIDLGSGKKTYAWLAAHCWEYGFILRYPEDKTETTGFNYEPWHFRYLGKTLAKAVYESGVTLEEYFVSIQ